MLVFWKKKPPKAFPSTHKAGLVSVHVFFYSLLQRTWSKSAPANWSSLIKFCHWSHSWSSLVGEWLTHCPLSAEVQSSTPASLCGFRLMEDANFLCINHGSVASRVTIKVIGRKAVLVVQWLVCSLPNAVVQGSITASVCFITQHTLGGRRFC